MMVMIHLNLLTEVDHRMCCEFLQNVFKGWSMLQVCCWRIIGNRNISPSFGSGIPIARWHLLENKDWECYTIWNFRNSILYTYEDLYIKIPQSMKWCRYNVYQCMRGLSEKVKGREVILKYKMVIISILTNKFVKLLYFDTSVH